MIDGTTVFAEHDSVQADIVTNSSSAYPQCDSVALVSVIIPHYNDLAGLRICVAALHQQTWPQHRMEIIIADNNSACGLQAVANAAPGCRVIAAPVQGAGPARNAGVAAARGEILAFIDSDCNPAPTWIAEGAAALAQYDFVGGEVAMTAENPQRPTPVEAWEIVFGFNFKRYILKEGYTGTGNMFVHRDVFDAVSGFRAGVAEDMDWSFRARDMGFHLGYAPKARVSHPARAQWDELQRRWRRVISEHYLLTIEKPYGAARWLAWTAAMPLSAMPHILRIAVHGDLPDLRARADAIGVLIRHRLWRTAQMARIMMSPPPLQPQPAASAQPMRSAA